MTKAPSTFLGIVTMAWMFVGGGVTSALADPTTYFISGDLTFNNCCGGQYVDSISGSFTYDPAGADSIDVTLTEIAGAGGSPLTFDEVAVYNTSSNVFQSDRYGDSDVLYLALGSDLTALPATETVTSATIVCGYACSSTSVASTAVATAAPEPASLGVLGVGLGLMAMVGRSRSGRAAATG